MVPQDKEIAATIERLVAERGAGKTICPSEAARALSAEWRPLMGEVRRVAADLQARGRVEGFQRGAPVKIARAHGPIRIGRPGCTERK